MIGALVHNDRLNELPIDILKRFLEKDPNKRLISPQSRTRNAEANGHNLKENDKYCKYLTGCVIKNKKIYNKSIL